MSLYSLNSQTGFKYSPLFSALILASFFLATDPNTAAAEEICKEGKASLIGEFDVIESRGGLWGFMEQTSALKEKSVLGLQTDSKIRRSIQIFENMCNDGKTPTLDLFKEIRNVISEGRMVFNLAPDRTPAKTILDRVTAVNDKATALLAKLGE